jgi:hypothetical protein
MTRGVSAIVAVSGEPDHGIGQRPTTADQLP